MYSIEVYPKYENGKALRIDWESIINALKSEGYEPEQVEDTNQVMVNEYYGEAVDIINALGYETDEDEADDED